MAKNIDIGGRLHSLATEHIVAGANEIQDDTLNKTQAKINEEVNNTLEIHDSAIEGLNSQNYVSYTATVGTTAVTDVFPDLGVVNTVYRLGNWDGTQYDTTQYSEYAWINTGIDQGEYVLLDVKNYGIDIEPTAGSDNLVKSGGVAIGIFDSQYKTEIALSWTTHKYSYINNAKVVTASASWTNVNLAKIDVSILVGQTLKIRSICSDGTPEYLSRNAVADVDDNLLIEINLTPSNEVSYITVPSGAKWLYLTNYPELSITEPYVKEGGDVTEKIGEIDENIEELAEKDKKNSSSLFFSQNPIPFIKDFLIDNTGDVIRFSNTNSNIYRYDVSSINDGASKILVYAKGLQDYYPDAYALGRFIIGGTIQPVPLVNQKYLDGYSITVPQNAEYFDIAVLPINGVYYIQVCIDDSNLTALSPIVNLNELDRKLVVIKTQISDSLIEWNDNYFCDGTKNIGQPIALVSGYTAYRTAKIDVESYRGQTIGIYCISDTDYNQYVGSFMCDGNDKIIEKDLYMNEYTPMRIVYIRSDAKYLYLSNYKTYASSFKVGLIDFSSFEKLQNNVDELKGEIINIRNQWKNKKILWLGTSIPWGQSNEDGSTGTHRVKHPYPQQVCDALGAILIDSTHGGLAQQAAYDENSGKWYPKPYTSGGTTSGGSSCLTIAECQAAYAAGLVSADLSAYSYENTLLGKNADLYIFDVEPNNDDTGSAADLALFDWYLWKYTDNSTFASHRDTYIGALIYEIDQLLTEKPNAVIVLVGEYIPMQSNDYMNSYGVRTQSKAICEKFHIGYINLAEKLCYNGKNKSQWVNTDKVHPKQETYDRMAKMLINELSLIA